MGSDVWLPDSPAVWSPDSLGMWPSRVGAPVASGLKLWLKADVGVSTSGSNVTAWADQSGNGNNVAQATGAKQPTFNSSSANGLPTVVFRNTADMFLGNASINVVPAGSARSIFAVLKAVATPTGVVAMFGANATPELALLNLINAESVPGAIWSDYRTKTMMLTSGGPLVSAATLCVAEWHVTNPVAGTITVNVNGVAQPISNNPLASSSDVGAGFWIGSDNEVTTGGKRVLNADLAEILVYDHVLSVGDAATTRAYLSAKYGLGL